MALMPYMEWISHQELKEKFYAILPDGTSPKRILLDLYRRGFIEKKYEGKIPIEMVWNKKVYPHLSGYLYVRRIVKKMPRRAEDKSKMDGTYGNRIAKKRAEKIYAAPKQPPKTTVKNLDIDDLNFIRSSTIKTKALGEMFKVDPNQIVKIRNHGHIPSHIKGQLSR